MLSKEQRIAALILVSFALVGWIVYAVWPSRQPVLPDLPDKKPRRSWEERKDSMRLADSLRYAQWAAEREQRYDSFRLADSMRRDEWKRIRQLQYDSFRFADSLWRDSVGFRFPKRIKKDTILNLNRCDTAELQLIRGIGPYAAKRIASYREQLGGFYTLDQLSDSALAPLHLDTLTRHFFIDPEDIRTISVNNSTILTLQQHPYIRFQQAKAIYNLRRKNVTLRSIDKLKLLPELSEEDINRIAPYLRFE